MEMKPVFTEDGVNYVYVQHNNLYVLALTRKNSNVMVILVFLEKLVEVRARAPRPPLVATRPPSPSPSTTRCARQIMREYFGSLEEESIRDNFVLVYELLDEVMDHGYPQVTSSSGGALLRWRRAQGLP